MDVYLILGRPEEDELLALKEEGNMRATRWMVHMTPEEGDKRDDYFQLVTINCVILSNHDPAFLKRYKRIA